MTQLTTEYMRKWENRLSKDQLQRAFDIAQINGWPPGSTPPIWVWADIYRQVEQSTNNKDADNA